MTNTNRTETDDERDARIEAYRLAMTERAHAEGKADAASVR